MPELDPLEHLSEAIDRPEQPDPTFAANLLDQLLDDLADATPDDAVPLRLQTIADTHDDDASGDPGSIHFIDLPETTQDRGSDARRWIIGAAAAVFVVLGGLALLSRDEGSPVATDDEGSPVTTIDDERSPVTTIDDARTTPAPVDEARQLAGEFMSARAAHDGFTMRALLADDAEIIEYRVAEPDDYLRITEFDRLTNVTISDVICRTLTPERVSCLYEVRNDISRHLRSTGYEIEAILTVREGEIVVVQIAEPFSIDLDHRYFVDWLGRTHPQDVAAVFDEATLQDRFTPESAVVFAARTPEFAARTPPSIAKLVADEPRFSTFTEALDRTDLVERLSVCTEGPETLFAPTNDAFDRYITATGLDRDDVLTDATWIETFLVDELFVLSGPTGLSNEAVDVMTRSGDIVTISGGADPRVQGVPVLADVRDIAACNGALNGIDDIYSPND